MSANSDLVLAGISAGGTTGLELLWMGATGATAPTEPVHPLGAGWYSLGYVDGEGITLGVDESSEDVNAFGTTVPVRVINTGSKHTVQVTCLETNQYVMDVYHRYAIGTTSPDAAGGFTVTDGAARVQRYAACIDVLDGTNYMRFYYPSVEVTDRAEISIGNGQPIKYTFTLTAYPSATTGIAVTKYYRIPELAVGS